MDSTYSAGDLRLDILGFSENALASIDKTVKSLDALSRSIKKINEAQTVLVGDKLEVLFTKIAKATNSINTQNIDNLAASAKALSSISKLDKLSNLDYDKVSEGFGKMSVAISPFINQVKQAEKSLNSLYGIMSKSGKKQLPSQIFSSSGKNSLSLFSLAKLTGVTFTARRLGGIVANIAQKGADFTETLNLWQVSMGNDLIPQATKFVDKMNEAYGVSEKTLMNAQAIFKNMLGSLGNITDQQAYILSEGITQMALDYASLYNQTFDEAFTKFQAALAGQVRPIRSVAGYDITEQTLFDLYQSLGGDKSMRQLNRTEKQLLSILAIYQQMERSGAQGDLAATMESFANQSRVAKERMQDILAYSGALVTHFLETSGIMKQFVGLLMFISDTLEAAAKATGALESQRKSDIFGDVTSSAMEASDAIDEMQGKLLDFDKFRSLDDSQNGNIGLDQTLLDALSSYKSILEGASIEATAVSDTIKAMSGLWDEDGAFNLEKWEDFKDILEYVGIAFGVIFGVKMIQNVTSFFVNMVKWFGKTNITILLFATALGLIISAIKSFADGDISKGLYIVAGAITAIGVAISLLTGSWIPLAIAAITGAIVAVVATVIKYKDQIKEFGAKLINTIVNTIVSGLNWLGDKLNAFLNKIGFDRERHQFIHDINIGGYGTFANGGLPDKGSMFIAGEAGAEYVYNMPNGQSGVANIQQIAQATYNGTISALNDWWGGSHARGDIPQLQEASATGMYQAVTGVARSYGERWDKY